MSIDLRRVYQSSIQEKDRTVRKMPRVTFISQDGRHTTVEAAVGLTILQVARECGVDLPGTCGGSMVCATCHVRIDAAYRSKLPPPSEAEEDTLDLAFGVTADSRLGCQIELTDSLDGIEIRLAHTTADL